MCFLVEDEDGADGSSSTGAAKLQLRRHHTWLVPQRVLLVILGLAIIFFFLGLVLLAIGGGIGSTGLKVTGGIFFGFGIIGFIICLIVCLYAYFFYGTRDQEIQTDLPWADEYLGETPGYASIGRPSALKSADSTLKRNGTAGQKKVTMAPEVGPYGSSPPHALQGGNVFAGGQQQDKSPSFVSGSGFLGDTKPDPRGVGGRSVGGAEVGTGGIRIMPADQPFPTTDSHVSYGTGGQVYSGSAGGQHVVYGSGSGHAVYSGGGSSASSSIDTYAYPKSVSIISGNESGYAESGSGSQYSTLRSIPVQHVVTTQQRQQDSVDYARVNKQGRNIQTITIDAPLQRGYLIQGQGGFPQGQSQGGFVQGQSSSSFVQGQSSSGFVQNQGGFIQGQSGHFQQHYPVEEDFDYDNPVERTPMLPPKQNQTYHEQQMQFQRHQRTPSTQSDLHAPRQVNTLTMQRQSAANPYYMQQQQQQHQTQYQTSHSSSSSHHMTLDDDLPEPQPLVYPSARRPMTFEQVSSSKMSVYDNVLAGLKDMDE